MDKNKIRSFAIWARRKMIESVTEKAERIGIKKDKIEEVEVIQGGFKLGEEIFYLPNKHREALKHEIKIKGFEEVMEEAAYTWFNRFMGLRYMEVNDYLPSGIRILSSSVEGKTEPDVLSNVSEIIDELWLNADEIYALLDTGNTIDREKAYRIILVKQCNELGKIIPQMFEKISDYTELLLPNNLLEEGSVIRKMVEDIEESDWKEEVEIIGWMYQYYISEKKDEVFAALKKNVKITKENIPATTQLFTPKWIVKYMVENSLGRLWLEGHPNEELQSLWKYYLEEAEQEPEVEEELKKIREEHSRLTPEDIKVLDPCMGSGHILVYAFDIFYEIYKSAGYSEREIPKLILEKNLYGLDIDDRAAQLASFALIMKARHYNRRLFREIEREHLELNLCSIQESNEITDEVIEYFCSGQSVVDSEQLRKDVKYLVDVFTDAKEYGSILEVKAVNFDAIKKRLREVEDEDNLTFGDYRKIIIDYLPVLIKQGEIMSRLYECCITNPPYMSNINMNVDLLEYVKKNYNNSSNDLYSVFMKKCSEITCNIGYYAMITQQSWMFSNSFEGIRKDIINHHSIIGLLHLGARTFEEIGGEVVQNSVFVVLNGYIDTFKQVFIKLSQFNSPKEKEKQYLNMNYNARFECNNNRFIKLPHNVMAYWLSDNILSTFNSKKIYEYNDVKEGLNTGNNDLFLRLWHEVSDTEFSLINQKGKWYPHNKGGGYRKWFGNNDFVINWSNNGSEVKNYTDSKGRKKATIRNEKYFFQEGATFSGISTRVFSCRYFPKGFTFNSMGRSIFSKDKILKYTIGLLNSIVGNELLKILAPTLSFTVGAINEVPIIIDNSMEIQIRRLVDENIFISKKDWDSFETSWDFKAHPLLKLLDKGQQYKLSSIFNIWKTECEENFNQLKSNEEELNRIFIDIYGLQDELTPEEEDKDVTIRKADRERDIKSLISYAVGCMFGRYSIDAEGLIYAGGEFGDKWKLADNSKLAVGSEQNNQLSTTKVRNIEKDDDGNVISDSWVNATFIPDEDNIIPITEDEYFEDDIVSRFITFIRTVYGEENLEENLDYIANSIGRKTSESARQAIRRYFIKDFYKDHLKIYQKRPIYWMFDSGKNNGFKCLIYMHRYNDQTIAKVRTDYLHTLQRKYESEINRQQLIIDANDSSTKDKTVAKKKIDKINKQIEECREYDEVVAYLANEKISIDLDDGVKVNYAKFQNVSIINSKNKEVKMNLLAKI